MSPVSPVAALLDELHAARPVRAWSLIVTLFGDAIVPRGGSLWLGSLTEIMALFRIDAGHVRTAMSRLTADGWLTRARVGRNTYYRLSKQAEASFAAATRRIYFGLEPPFDGRLRIALLGPGVDDRSAVRPALAAAGFAALSPTAYVGVADPPVELSATPGVFVLRAAADDSRKVAEAAWTNRALDVEYRRFLDRFEPTARALAAGGTLDGADAMVTRTLLIHHFRRVVLRDPGLPAVLLPPDWPGTQARALAAQLYRRLVPASEAWLDRRARAERGPLGPPDAMFTDRFSLRP
jgi:phenylacetic acid degradation operon negative regulatory protein